MADYENGRSGGKGAYGCPGIGEWIMRYGSENPLIHGPNGQKRPRGEVRPKVTIAVRYVPVNASLDTILGILGCSDSGQRIPYDQIPPNVSPIPIRCTVFHDLSGRIIEGKKEEPLHGAQRERVLKGIPFKNRF